MPEFHVQSDVIQVNPNLGYNEVTSEMVAGMATGVSTVMASRILTGVAEVNVRVFSIIVLLTAPICLVELLIQLALSRVFWFLSTETFLHYMESQDFLYRKYMFLLQAFYRICY
jgi:hypothetical protein